MVEILDGERFDVSSGSTKIHRGTRSYLKKIGATPKDGSERKAPLEDVDQEGKYQPRETKNAPRS
jgi:hypothetical protein